MEDVDQTATHSEEVTDQPVDTQAGEQQQIRDAYAAFDLEYPQDQATDEEDQDDTDVPSDPPIDDEEQPEDEEPKGITVKYNGQDVFIPEDEVVAHARKGLNYDKIESRSKQYESALDRLARQQGFKDHAALLENLDHIEQQAAQQKLNDFEQLKSSLREDAENAGIDPDLLDRYLDNHPLLQQAQEAVQRSQREQEYRQQEEQQQRQLVGWQMLFDKYPTLAEQVDADTGTAAWMTPDMQERLNRGYDPIDAYELVHRSSLAAEERKRTEQSVIKAQRLNKRAQVEKNGHADLEPQAPEELTSAFAMFGLDPKNAQKYAKNFK
ncbi:hypothetical protein ACU1JV_21910 [Paenibacillus sp. T2-29]